MGGLTGTTNGPVWTDLWRMFDPRSLAELEEAFLEESGVMDLVTFTEAVQKCLLVPAHSDRNFVAAIIDLFQRADLDGVGWLKWEAFTMFLVETGMELYHTTDITMTAPSAQYRSSSIQGHVWSRRLEKMRYIKSLERLLVLERGCDDVCLVDPNTGQIGMQLPNADGHVLAWEHLVEHNFLVVSARGLTLWDLHSQQVHNRIPNQRHTMTSLRWVEQLPVPTLISGCSDGTLYGWHVEWEGADPAAKFAPSGKSSLRTLSCKWSIKAHTQAVMDLMFYSDKRMALFTASLDGSIKVWEFPSRAHRRTWGTPQGVTQLDYHIRHNLLISVGFDHHALIWIEKSPANKPITKLSHNALLLGAYAVQALPQIVSMDMLSVIKVWDCRSFTCVQTLEYENPLPYSASGVGGFCIIEHRMVIAVAGRTIDFFHTTNSEIARSGCTDEQPVVFAHYNSSLDFFFAAAGAHVKVFDSQSGTLRRVFADLVPTEITAICVDQRQLKLFLGDHAGNVVVYNAETGSMIKELQRHEDEVSCLLYVSEIGKLLSSSWDHTVGVHDEKLAGKRSRRLIVSKSDELVCLACHARMGILSAGSAQGVIESWKLVDGSVVRSFAGHNSEILCLQYCSSGDAVFLLSADNASTVKMWTVSDFKFRCILTATNSDLAGKLNPVVSMEVFGGHTLWTGDDYGEIKQWNLEPIFIADRDKTKASLLQVTQKPGTAASKPSTSQSQKPTTPPLRGPTPPTMEIVNRWKGHEFVVSAVQYVPELDVVVTAGLDCYACVWSSSGVLLGSLTQPKDSADDDEFDAADKVRADSWHFNAGSGNRKNLLERADEVLDHLQATKRAAEDKDNNKTHKIHRLALFAAGDNLGSVQGSPSKSSLGIQGRLKHLPRQPLSASVSRRSSAVEGTGYSPAPLPPTTKPSPVKVPPREEAQQWAAKMALQGHQHELEDIAFHLGLGPDRRLNKKEPLPDIAASPQPPQHNAGAPTPRRSLMVPLEKEFAAATSLGPPSAYPSGSMTSRR